MSILVGLSDAQMRRIEPYFRCRTEVHGSPDRRVVSEIFCSQERAALARCAERPRPAQDDPRAFHSLESAGRVQSYLRGAGGEGRQARPADAR